MFNLIKKLYDAFKFRQELKNHEKHLTPFFYNFYGKRIYIITDNADKKTTVTSTVGYLLDMDEKYYYLGDTLDGVTHWVPIAISGQGELVPEPKEAANEKGPKDKYDRLLDQLSIDEPYKQN